MKQIRASKNDPKSLSKLDAKRMNITYEGLKAIMRAIDNVCDPDGWTTVSTELHQLCCFYDDTDDLPHAAYQEALTKVEFGQIKPSDLDPRLCDKCDRGLHSDLHKEECLDSNEEYEVN